MNFRTFKVLLYLYVRYYRAQPSSQAERRRVVSTTPQYVTAEEFLKDALPTTEVDDVFNAIDKANEGKLLDEARIRRGQDWSALSQQIVGAEVGCINRF